MKYTIPKIKFNNFVSINQIDLTTMKKLLLSFTLMLFATLSAICAESGVSKYKFNPRKSQGVIHGTENIAKMKRIIATQNLDSKGYQSYLDFANYPVAKSTWREFEGKIPTYIARGGGKAGDRDQRGDIYTESFSNNASLVTRHFDAAYMSALQYALGVEDAEAHAAKATAILKGYADQVEKICYTGNAPLMCGQGYHAAAALSLLEGYSGMSRELHDHITNDLLKGCFIPILDHFFARDPYTNGNWGTCAILTYITIAVVADDKEMYDFAIRQYLTGEGCSSHNPKEWDSKGYNPGKLYNGKNDNGTIFNYIDPITGQCQETGRDQGHAIFGMANAALICEVAYNQGHKKLYRENQDALMKGMEYAAELLLYGNLQSARASHRYFVWKDVTSPNKYSRHSKIGTADTEHSFKYTHGFATVYNHFVNRLGLEMPYTKKLLERVDWQSNYSPEGLWFDMFTFAPHKADN